MEPETRKVRKRIRIRKKSFFKRKWLGITYREITLYLILTIVMILGIFHGVIYNYFFPSAN